MYVDDWKEESDDVFTRIEQLIEDDQISPEEAAFMMGYVGM